jgi:protocatechuate 3,4-dioxygenase beta subunit
MVWLMAATADAQEDGGFAIRGRVVDAAAKPVAGAMVRLVAPGFNGFDVDEKTATAADGRFNIAAPGSWIRMDATQRQELALLALQGNRVAVVQFNRSSAPPRSEVELTLSNAGASKIEIRAPDLRPVAGAKVKIAALISDMIFVDLTEAELQQYRSIAKKTAIGYVIGTGTVSLPPDLQIDVGATDAKGLATVSQVAAARIAAITAHTDEFGEQAVGYYSVQGASAPNWIHRIVLKKTGQVAGQLSSPIAGAVAQREVTLTSFEQDNASGVFHSSSAKIVTDSEGRFEVSKMVPGAVQFAVKFDPRHPTRPDPTMAAPHVKAGETVQVKIDLKPAVRVEGRVLETDSRKPIRDVKVGAFLGTGFESTSSDAAGKFVFWMPAGETLFHPDIPEEYLSALSPSDYFDAGKRQQKLAIFKVPAGQSFEAPPILLQRRATLRGVVVDDQGRPLPGAGVSGIAMSLDRRTGAPKAQEVSAQANERGEFTITRIDPREPMRLRVTAKQSSKIVTVAKPGSEGVRVVIAPHERFTISGRVADAERKPVADAVLEIWHRDWRPAPNEAEPKKLEFKEPIRADLQGRFQTPPLLPDGYYRFTVRAAGAKTSESAWLDATKPEAGTPQQLVVTRLGGLPGVVRDRAGKPIAGAQVALFSLDTRMETAANGQGEFKLEIPAGKPFCVIARHPDFRVAGSYYEKNPSHLDQTLLRLSEPGTKLARRPILSKAEREKTLKRLLERVRQKLAKAADSQEKVMALQSLTGVVPDLVTDFLDKNPLQPAQDNEMLLAQAAMKKASQNPEEGEELIGRMEQGAQKSLAYGRLVDALPETARARKLEILAEALVGARAEKSPELRAVALGEAAKRLYMLGDKDRAATILREGEKIANGLSTSAFAGYARGAFATDLALIDLPAALALMKDLKDRSEFARHHGNTAHRIAGMHAAEAVRVLERIPLPRQNEFSQRDQYAIRVCYRMAQADLQAALKLANSIVDVPSQAYALGVIAQGVAKTDPGQAADLLRRAFALLEEDAALPDPPQLTSPLIAGSVAAALVLAAEQIDPTLVRECLWRSVALQRPPTENPQQVWRYATGNNALAMVAARYDGKLAELLLPARTADWVSREAQLAGFLANPQRAVATVEKAPQGKDDREVLQLIGYLATDEDGISRLILNTLGIWRIDVEDIDY